MDKRNASLRSTIVQSIVDLLLINRDASKSSSIVEIN